MRNLANTYVFFIAVSMVFLYLHYFLSQQIYLYLSCGSWCIFVVLCLIEMKRE